MYNKKRIIAGLLILSVIISLAGCGSTQKRTAASGSTPKGTVASGSTWTTDQTSKRPGLPDAPEWDPKEDDEPETGSIRLSANGQTVYVDGGVYDVGLKKKVFRDVRKIVFSKDAKFLNPDFGESEIDDWTSYFSKMPLLEEIEVEEGNPFMYEKDGLLIGAIMNYDHEIPRPENFGVLACVMTREGEVRIPDGIEWLGFCPFNGCKKITSIYVPASMKDMEGVDFGNMPSCKSIEVDKDNKYYYSKDGVVYGLEQKAEDPDVCLVAYPAGRKDAVYREREKIDAVGKWAFLGVEYLKEVYLPSTCSDVSEWAFEDCQKLEKVEVRKTTG